ncbi:hypothetical protein BHE74_00045515 [Ensete ventricosum]|nr:hypothetical protein BHE74_00045515 [Ensete ventricosum]
MTMRIMQSLQNNLDGKSKQYKDPALTYLFLMNNIHYMVRSLSSGQDHLQIAFWCQFTNKLETQLPFSFIRFKSFNMQFEELHQRQSQWVVPDRELREYLRLAVAEVLLPAYRSFIKRFGYVPLNP